MIERGGKRGRGGQMFTVTTFDQWTDSVGRLLESGVPRSSAVLFMASYIVVRQRTALAGLP
jgi:hypothetical protein